MKEYDNVAAAFQVTEGAVYLGVQYNFRSFHPSIFSLLFGHLQIPTDMHTRL